MILHQKTHEEVRGAREECKGGARYVLHDGSAVCSWNNRGFGVEVGLHQGSALSPFLFALVMDRLTDGSRQEGPWTMMFSDDIVICSEHKGHAKESLESWRQALERRRMKVSRSKTEYMCVNAGP